MARHNHILPRSLVILLILIFRTTEFYTARLVVSLIATNISMSWVRIRIIRVNLHRTETENQCDVVYMVLRFSSLNIG